ncbi:MAG: hypothetical protein M1821_009834 [Bathelium mastoideum]|nr:MAG: hypothetical protein M1821_009834 [Bathelium mastoideum]KAI9690409.1 MAG: hypothetical protein M1822_009372 [Bathelium mastoideum]
MAAVIIGAGALFTERLREKRKAQKAARREYEENFEQLKAANAARVRHILQSSTDKPPTYDELLDNNGGLKQSATARQTEAVQRSLQSQHQTNRRAVTLAPVPE